MRRRCFLPLILLSAWLAPAHAGMSPPGVNLSWDRCFGEAGVRYRTFACDTNTGSENLVASFELASELPSVNGFELHFDIGSAASTLPAWWELWGALSCRPISLSAQAAPPAGETACTPWNDPSLVSVSIAEYARPLPDRRHLVVIGACLSTNAVTLQAGQEYFASTLRINHSKTVGTGACGGCQEPVVVFLSAIVLSQDDGSTVRLSEGANTSSSKWVSWQQGYPMNARFGCAMTGGGLFCFHPSTYFDVVVHDPTPARATTWGGVKSLYR